MSSSSSSASVALLWLTIWHLGRLPYASATSATEPVVPLNVLNVVQLYAPSPPRIVQLGADSLCRAGPHIMWIRLGDRDGKFIVF